MKLFQFEANIHLHYSR